MLILWYVRTASRTLCCVVTASLPTMVGVGLYTIRSPTPDRGNYMYESVSDVRNRTSGGGVGAGVGVGLRH